MKLIENFVERFHNYTLPLPEKCFLLEEGDELYIKIWIKNGKINGKMKDVFEWMEKKYFFNNKQLENTDKKKYDELRRRFYLKNWRIILLMCEYQAKYRYYSKAINSVKDKSSPEMKNKDFLKLFENNQLLNQFIYKLKFSFLV